jgi:hypothetical protein
VQDADENRADDNPDDEVDPHEDEEAGGGVRCPGTMVGVRTSRPQAMSECPTGEFTSLPGPGVPGEDDVDLGLMTLLARSQPDGRMGRLLMRNTSERPIVSVHPSPARFAS